MLNNFRLVIHPEETFYPKGDSLSDNGNPDTQIRKPNIPSTSDVLSDYRDYETDLIDEDVLSESEHDRDSYGIETPCSQSSNESNGLV